MRRKNSSRVYLLIFFLLSVIVALAFLGRNFFFSDEGVASLLNTRNLIFASVVGLLALIAAVAPFNDIVQLWDRFKPSKRPLTPEEIRQNRENMLKNMELRIAQTLKSKLLTDEWLKLGFKFDPEQIATLEAPQEWRTDGEVQTIRRGTKPITIFDDRAASALLILGEPGSGKTITLFRLAKELLERAMKEDAETIPIMFNLASWAEKQPALDEWLIEQLERVYRVPERVAHYWLEHGALTLLLDGLDEIRDKTKREACMQAINAYRVQQNLTKIAVCSRIDEYEELTTQLELNGAIVIRELKPAQAKRFLKNVVTNESYLLQLLETNEVVKLLAKRPLTLNILVIATRGLSIRDLSKLVEDPKKILPRLYDVYIEQMLQHRGEVAKYPLTQTKRWLTWLAFQMKQRNQKVFLADTLQPDWIPNTFVNRLILGLSIGLILGQSFGLILGLIYGLPLGLRIGIFGWLLFGPSMSLILGLSLGFIDGLLGRLNKRFFQFINLNSNLRVNFKKFIRSSRKELFGGLIIGLFFGLFWGQDIFGFSIGMLFGLSVGALLGLLSSFSEIKANVISEESIYPAEPIYRNLRTALYLFGIFSIWGGLIFGGLYGSLGLDGFYRELSAEIIQLPNITWTTIDGVKGGLAGSLLGFAGMLQALDGVIHHSVLKWLLARQDFIPVNLFSFLDFATERQLLVRPGGHYEFFHQTLQDHFAAMWENQYANEE